MTRRVNIIVVLMLGVVSTAAYFICTARIQTIPKNGSKPTQVQTESTPVRIAFVQALSGLPLFVALEDDILERTGAFDPLASQHDSSDLCANQLKSGEADVIFAGLSQVMQVEAENPGSLKIVGVLYSSVCLVTSTRPGAPLSISDLRSRRIGIFPGNSFEIYVEKALAKEGLERGSYEIVKLPPPLQLQQLAAATGGVDALCTLEPAGGQAIARGTGKYLVEGDIFAKHFLNGSHFPGGVIAVSREYLKKYPTAGDRIVHSLHEAMLKIASPGFKQDIYLKKFTKISEADSSVLRFEGGEIGVDINHDPLRRVIELLKEWGKLPASADVERALIP